MNQYEIKPNKNERNGIAEAIPFLNCQTMISYWDSPCCRLFCYAKTRDVPFPLPWGGTGKDAQKGFIPLDFFLAADAPGKSYSPGRISRKWDTQVSGLVSGLDRWPVAPSQVTRCHFSSLALVAISIVAIILLFVTGKKPKGRYLRK